MKLFISIILAVSTFTSFGQHRGHVKSELLLTGGIGYPYQSGMIAFPLNNSMWHLYGQINTDLGGIATNLSFSDNQSIGVLREFEMNKKTYTRFGVGVNFTLHSLPLSSSGATGISQIYHKINPWLSIGATYQQPLVTKKAWTDYNPIIQLNTSIHLPTQSKNNGIFRAKKYSSTMSMHLSTGIYHSAVGISRSLSKYSPFSIRAQVFTKGPTFFEESSKTPAFQWIGATYLKKLYEVEINGGVGAGLRVQDLTTAPSPVVFIGLHQNILPETSITLNIWQPALKTLNSTQRPFILTGISIRV